MHPAAPQRSRATRLHQVGSEGMEQSVQGHCRPLEDEPPDAAPATQWSAQETSESAEKLAAAASTLHAARVSQAVVLTEVR